jgi:type I restriction enzyme R subunit
MSQSEAQLENQLLSQLKGLGYSPVRIPDAETLVANLQAQLELFNETTFTDKEFAAILNHLSKGNIFEKAKTLRDRFHLSKEDGTSFYVRFFDSEARDKNLFQVTNQVSIKGSYLNRYDVTLLVNGLPLTQIELKRRGLEIKEAFHQINRYQRHSFWSSHGLFQYVQLFIISNGGNTKYLANNSLQSVKQTFFWADVNNKNTTDLTDFANAFMTPAHLSKMIARYIVMNETHKIMMVLRPYQYHAAEAIVKRVQTTTDNGYIWHTTGSGKTLTSFKASQILMNLPEVHKVVFVVDRKDLDYQTMNEFNAFKKDSVDVTNNTASLVRQLTDDTKLVLTTIQKLNNAVSERFSTQIADLQDKRVVFIFDECHRSQFGETHDRIVQFFRKSQLFGFTGTPIFVQNSSKNALGKRTTKTLFHECLHKYVITDAIHDQNVLRFGIEYIGKYKNTSNRFIDIEVEDINTKEVLDSEKRLTKIADYIIAIHDQKTFNRDYSSLFAVSSIETLIKYYEIFQQKKEAGEHDLRIAAIFSYGANVADMDAQDYLPDEDEALPVAADLEVVYSTNSSHNRDKLDSFISDYNAMFGKSYSTKDSRLFEGYFKDLSRRMKDRERKGFQDKDRLDIILVVNMMLTGFDAKKVNTLYVDKNLKTHGLVQAFSRTNRILGEQKSQGNILCFRNLKKATDEAITLFSNKEAIETVVMPDYEVIAEKFDKALESLLLVTPTYQSVDDLQTEEDELKFVKAFRRVMRAMNVLQSYADFDWDEMPISKQTFEDYAGKYADLKEKVQRENAKEKTSILNDVDFELELIHRDRVNVAYIFKLLAQLKDAKEDDARAQKQAILDQMAGDVKMRSKRELIEKFIDENLPKIHDSDMIEDEFEMYWQEQKVLAIRNICEEEDLDVKQFRSLMDTYIFSGQEPIKDDVIKCLDNRPSILKARTISNRIIGKMREFIEVFVQGMTG